MFYIHKTWFISGFEIIINPFFICFSDR
jgi:hypothetical protein